MTNDFTEEDEFRIFLDGELGLAPESVKQYLIYYRAWNKGSFTLDQQSVRMFLNEFSGNSARAFLKKFVEFKNAEHIIIKNPTGKSERKQGMVISEEEYERIRPLLYRKGMKFGLIGDIQFYGGARRSEVMNMKADDINASEWDEGKKMRIKVSGKKATRSVVIPAKTAQNLINYIAELVAERTIHLDSNPVILQQLGKSRWAKVLGDASFKATGKKISTHTLRRSRATLWHRQGLPVEKIQVRLGHANLNTTMIYVKLDQEDILSEWESEDE